MKRPLNYWPQEGDRVERLDRDGWGPGTIIDIPDNDTGDARVRFDADVVAWVDLDDLAPAEHVCSIGATPGPLDQPCTCVIAHDHEHIVTNVRHDPTDDVAVL